MNCQTTTSGFVERSFRKCFLSDKLYLTSVSFVKLTMGRQIIAEERVESHVNTLFTKDKWLIGVIIGQVTAQKDYAVHLAPTPKVDPESVVDEDDGKVTKPQSQRGVGQSLDKVDESWVVTHARQVMRMLPGGFDILGVFAMAPPEVMTAAQAKLRQVLFAISKVNKQSNRDSPSTDRVLLQICSVTRKLACKTFDVSDLKSSSKPADWKYQRYLDRWHRLETTVALDSFIPVYDKDLSKTLEKQILQGMSPFCDNIWNSLATIDSEIASGERLLNPNQPQGRKGKKQQEEATGNIYTVQLLARRSAVPVSELSPPTVTPCGARLALRGTMCCRAFVHAKASLDEAIKALKTDVVRSLYSRCELLCEDLLQAEEQQDHRVLYETPVRVYAPLPDSSVQLCDYMFQDETNNDVVDRFKELVGLVIPEDTLETGTERVPDDSDLAKPVHSTESATPPQSSSQTSSQILVTMLCALAALVAVVLGVLYANDTNG